ncbi:unnamed protein product, partial [Dovyalis caffra]
RGRRPLSIRAAGLRLGAASTMLFLVALKSDAFSMFLQFKAFTERQWLPDEDRNNRLW